MSNLDIKFRIINNSAYPDFVSNYVQLMYQFNKEIMEKGFSSKIWEEMTVGDRFLTSEMEDARNVTLIVIV